MIKNKTIGFALMAYSIGTLFLFIIKPKILANEIFLLAYLIVNIVLVAIMAKKYKQMRKPIVYLFYAAIVLGILGYYFIK